MLCKAITSIIEKQKRPSVLVINKKVSAGVQNVRNTKNEVVTKARFSLS
jgi:hypothetical protein